jgi:protease PrsW
MYCGKCGCHVEDQARFCGHCGAPLPRLNVTGGLTTAQRPDIPSSKAHYCGKCGSPLAGAAAYCGHCGTPVSERDAEEIAGTDTTHIPSAVESKARGMSCFNKGVLVLILTFGACALFTVNSQMIADQQFDARTMVVVTIASIVPAIFYGALIISVDVREREPGRILLFAFLWGALVAAVGSYFVSGEIYWIVMGNLSATESYTEFLMAVVTAPYVEELAKTAGLLAIIAFFRKEFNNVTDGIVYGALIGLGFSVTENILYLGWAHMEEGTEGFALLFYTRVVLGGLGHATYTALAGAGFGYARERSSTKTKLGAPLLGLLFAMAGHSVWNGVFALLLVAVLSPDDPFLFLVVVPMIAFVSLLPGLVAVAILLIRSWRREADIIDVELRTEVRNGLITSEEHARLGSVRARLASEINALSTNGFSAWRATRRFHQKATQLAFRKSQIGRERSSVADEGELDTRYRDAIRALRAEMTPASRTSERDIAVPG